MSMIKCQNCGEPYSDGLSRCPNCKSPAPIKKCPYCETTLPLRAKFCRNCGKPVETESSEYESKIENPASSSVEPAPKKPLDLNKAEDMWEFCIESNFQGAELDYIIRPRAEAVERILQENEKVQFCFCADDKSTASILVCGEFFVVTDCRFIICNHADSIKSIPLRFITGIRLLKPVFKNSCGTIYIETVQGEVEIAVKRSDRAEFVYESINKILLSDKNSSGASPQTFSVADEIIKFKQLLDMGAITQEEYDKKKQQLLNL